MEEITDLIHYYLTVMSKTMQLQQLFSKWQQNWPAGERFYEDGIINEDLFETMPTDKKLLFIAKEPNASNHSEIEGVMSFVKEWSSDTPPGYPFALRIAEWATGIISDFPDFDSIHESRMGNLKKIAFMNVKKIGGSGVAENLKIHDFATRYSANIQKQIGIIAPDIIVLSISFDKKIRALLFPGANWKSSGYSTDVALWNNTRIIDFYHPSSRNAPAASYALLKAVCTSKTFKEL